jgi:hypothetical protein
VQGHQSGCDQNSSKVTKHKQCVLLCKQQHSKKVEIFVVMVYLKHLRVFKKARQTVCIFFLFFLFVRFIYPSEIFVLVFVLMRVHCRVGAQPRCPVGGRSVSLCFARYFRTANSTPLISISRHLAPFEELSLKVITQKFPFQSSASVHTWAPARSRIFEPASQKVSRGSG